MRKNWYPEVLGLALGAVLIAGGQLAIMPTRRRDLEPGAYLQPMPADHDKQIARALRKRARRRALADLQAKAARGIA